VHQDGLVHVSAMSRTFVSDPRSVVKPGDVVRVKVLSVDIPRHRISLTLRLDDDEAPPPQAAKQAPRQAGGRAQAGDRPGRPSGNSGRTERGARPRPASSGPEGALADALRRAGLVPPDTEAPRHR
jgi:protein Tex